MTNSMFVSRKVFRSSKQKLGKHLVRRHGRPKQADIFIEYLYENTYVFNHI